MQIEWLLLWNCNLLWWIIDIQNVSSFHRTPCSRCSQMWNDVYAMSHNVTMLNVDFENLIAKCYEWVFNRKHLYVNELQSLSNLTDTQDFWNVSQQMQATQTCLGKCGTYSSCDGKALKIGQATYIPVFPWTLNPGYIH